MVFLALSQFIRPARTNPPTDLRKTLEAVAHPPATVAATLDRACGDCHTNRTRWPWYTNVAPISWWIIDHVDEGRRRVSYSDWGDYDPARQRKELAQTCQRVESGNMPLTTYLLVHWEAALSDSDRRAICDWSRAMLLIEPH
jgi:Haem-binding domain